MYVVFDNGNDFEIKGAGTSANEAQRSVAEELFVPSDFDAENWDAIDWDTEMFAHLGWKCTPEAEYRSALLDHQYRQLYSDGELWRSALDQIADAAGIHDGPQTRRDLADLAAEMAPKSGSDYDTVIREFLARKGHAEAEDAGLKHVGYPD